jgi:hypothetical protein
MSPPFRRSYAMHGAIAAGGMATVHVGRLVGPRGFTRCVAIKRLHPQLAANAEMASMFADEARVSARIIHANVVPVLDVVQAEGELLLVMEYVHGESLSRLLGHARAEGEAVSASIVAAILGDVLHGLHAAHEARGEDGHPLRVVHRDVSPQNVLVGADGIARVVDFGIAKAVGMAPVTRDGQLRGKVPYMAPEQLARRSIDRRVDVWAAGVVLWEALAGKRLFEAEDDQALMGHVLEDVIAPPSQSNGAVPPELDAITLRALERDPDRRFPDARAMATALEAAASRAGPQGVGDWVKRHAAAALAHRDDRIAEMERAAGDGTGEPEVPAIRAPFASVFLQDDEVRSALTAAESPVPSAPAGMVVVGSVAPPPPHDRRLVLAGAGALLVAFGAAATFLLTHRADATPPASAVASSAPADPEATAADPAATPGAPSFTTVAAQVPSSPGSAASPGAAASASAAATGARPAGRVPVSVRVCKVFDADKKIFVMRPMRVSRCP